jgi:membrane-associated phospholipid phosphatase
VVLAYAIAFPVAGIAGMQIDYGNIAKLLYFPLAFLAVFAGWCGYRGIPTLRTAVEAVSAGLLLSLPAMVFVYLTMRLDMPLADNLLAASDRFLGIDWPSMIAFIDRYSLLCRILLWAYGSFGYQLLAIPFLLALFGRMARSYRMVCAYGTIVFIACIISIRFPAFGTVATYPLDTSQLQNLNPYFWSDFVTQLHAIRENPDFIFRLTETKGIMTFPSVHAAVSVLCAWAIWDLKLLRYPVLLLDLLMAVSAFTIANHYVIDVIAGAAVAAASIWLVCFVTKARTSRHPVREAATTA